MQFYCEHCKCLVPANKLLSENLKNAKQKKMTLFMASCSTCHRTTPVNPMNLQERHQEPNHEIIFRCPTIACAGYAVQIYSNSSTWGCGQCGNVWLDKNTLCKSISLICKRFEYRCKVYIKNGDDFSPVPVNDEPKDYADIVEHESC